MGINNDNPFIENSLEENITMIISRAFDLVLDKAVRGYCPFIQVDTIFVSKEEAKYYRWSNGWEVGFHRLDFSGKSKDFINRDDEVIPVGDLSIENTLVLLNGIVRQWERFEDEEEPSSVVCDVQYTGEIKDSRLYIVPIGFKSQWDNTIMIHYLFKSFALIWHKLLPDIERKIKHFKTFDDVKELLDADDVVQDACIRKLNELFAIDGNSKELYRVFSSLAIQPYESQSNHGKLAVVDEQNLDKSDIVKFDKPVTISNDSIRQIRKILEMTKKEWNILVIDGKIMGLGKEIPFRGKICFTKPGCWNITIGNEVVFFAEGTRFSIVVSAEDVPFHDKYRECFEKARKWGTIEKIIKEAREQKHGTTIIVSGAAKEEAKRLCDLGYGIAVSPFSGDAITGAIMAATAIDGAIIVDRKGTCYAIGVILDGKAKVKGNPARGARYNSIYNYLTSELYMKNDTNCMAIIVSEDGSIDVVTSMEIKRKKPQLQGNG